MPEEMRGTESARTIIVRLSPATHKALRIKVAEEDTSIQNWVEALIERTLGIGEVDLNQTMVKCLQVLSSGKPMSMPEIAAACGMKNATTPRTAIGSTDKAISKRIAEKYNGGRPCLLDTGMVRAEQHDAGGRHVRVYVITKKGLAALAKVEHG